MPAFIIGFTMPVRQSKFVCRILKNMQNTRKREKVMGEVKKAKQC